MDLTVFFNLGRGLRQGVLLSPFLFVLVMEVLTRIIKREEETNIVHDINIARFAPSISHLLFTDDVGEAFVL